MLYIMRHGKTDWNIRHKLQGRTNVPLNAEGCLMAEAAREEYADVHFDICYCSPLDRAWETAKILLRGRNVPIIPDGRLIEIGLGIYEGFENSFQVPDCPINVLFKEPENYTVPVEGGESLEQLFSRTGEFIEQEVMPQLAQGKDILIVGHAVMNASIFCRMKSIPLRDLWSVRMENCKLIRLA